MSKSYITIIPAEPNSSAIVVEAGSEISLSSGKYIIRECVMGGAQPTKPIEAGTAEEDDYESKSPYQLFREFYETLTDQEPVEGGNYLYSVEKEDVEAGMLEEETPVTLDNLQLTTSRIMAKLNSLRA